MKTLIWIY